MSTGPRAGDPSLETSRTHTSLWLLHTEQRALQKVTKILKTRCCVPCRGEQEEVWDVSQERECNLISLERKVFQFISVPKACTEQYKATNAQR